MRRKLWVGVLMRPTRNATREQKAVQALKPRSSLQVQLTFFN